MRLSRASITGLLRGQRSDSLRTSLLAGTSGTLVLNVGALAWNFLGVVLLTHALSPRGYGAYVYALAWSTVLGTPAVLGLPALVVRHVAASHSRGQFDLARGLIRWSYRWVLLASLVVVLVGPLGLIAIGRGQPEVQRAYVVGLALIPLVALTNLSEAVMRGLRHVVQGRIAVTTVQPLALVLLLLAARPVAGEHLGAGAAMGLTAAAAAVALAVSLVLTARAIPETISGAEPRDESRTWFRSARPLLLQSVAAGVYAQTSLIMVGALTDVSGSGVFNTALRWATFVGFLQAVVNFPMAPAMARLHATDDRPRLQRLIARSARTVTFSAIPVAAGLIVFRTPALRVFGDSFVTGGTALGILVAGELVNVMSGSVTFALAMTGHEQTLGRATLGAVIAGLGLGLLLIPPFGVNGAAVARAASTAGLSVVLVWRFWRLEGICSAVVGRRLLERLAPPAGTRS